MKYRKGYKYQLAETYYVHCGIYPDYDVYTPFIHLSHEGLLSINGGYAWDGPSGPALDTKSFMRASLVHDALYQLIRLYKINHEYRVTADNLMRKMCREDGMGALRAWWTYRAVRAFGGNAAIPGDAKEIIQAP